MAHVVSIAKSTTSTDGWILNPLRSQQNAPSSTAQVNSTPRWTRKASHHLVHSQNHQVHRPYRTRSTTKLSVIQCQGQISMVHLFPGPYDNGTVMVLVALRMTLEVPLPMASQDLVVRTAV